MEGATWSEACQVGEVGSGHRERGTERNSSRLLSTRSLKLDERFPGSSALRGEREGVERGNIILLEEEKWERIN